MQDFIVSKLTGREKLKDDHTEIERELEQLSRTDQVLYFLEYEIEGYSKYIPAVLKATCIQDTPRLESLRYAHFLQFIPSNIPRADYLASLVEISLVDSLLATSVDEYMLLRSEYMAGGKKSSDTFGRRIEACRESLATQLKHRDALALKKQTILGRLRNIITTVKLRKLQDTNQPNLNTETLPFSTLGDSTISAPRRSPQFTVDEIRAIISSPF